MTSRTFAYVILAVVCLLTRSSGQIIALGGTVKDSYSGSVIESATVEIRFDDFTRAVVLTDVLGKWSYIQQSADDRSGAFPAAFDLAQNYPNPFNPTTTFSFSVPFSGPAELAVYTVLGQQVDRRVFDLDAGTYSIAWNGGGAAGTYFAVLRHGGRSHTRRMVQLDGGHNGGWGSPYRTGAVVTGLSKGSAAGISVIVSKFGYEPDTLTAVPNPSQNLITPITTIHRAAFVFDLHNDVAEHMVGGYQIGQRNLSRQSDLPRLRDGGVDAQMIVLWPDPSEFPANAYDRTIEMYDTCMAQFGRNSSAVSKATTIAGITAASSAGKLAAVFCVEGGIAIQEDLAKLKDLYSRGARYMTITWNNSLSWATAASDAQSATRGLNDFGRQVVRTMDSLGMIIDVSHTGIKTIEDILAVTKNPIIASHSGARALRNHTRNLTDDQIKAIAAGGGVIGVVFYTSFLSSAAASGVNVDTVVKHIDYIKNLVGIDHVAIGSDYDGGITAPKGLEDVSKLGNLTLALLNKGYSPADVRKILGGNFLRVFKAVCEP